MQPWAPAGICPVARSLGCQAWEVTLKKDRKKAVFRNSCACGGRGGGACRWPESP